MSTQDLQMDIQFEEELIAALDSQFDNALAHYGMPRRSGRYPWGSGENPYQDYKSLLGHVAELRAKGLSDAEIAKGLGMKSSTELRALRTIANQAVKESDILTAMKFKDKGMSNVAIGQRMGINESSVRSLLDPKTRERNANLTQISDYLKTKMKDGYLDIGSGVEAYLGVSDTKKNTAVAMLEQEGYKKFHVPVEQFGTNQKTTTMIITPPGTTFPEVMKNLDKINSVSGYSEDGGRTFRDIKAPVAVNPDRVAVRYKGEGGETKDGVIELRRGVDDLSLGGASYAQVRIKVGEDSYLKGMAVYSDSMPDGVDMIFNTNKEDTGNKFDAMKGIKADGELPFGSIVRQKHYVDADGKEHQSPLNIVGSEGTLAGEEGAWGTWSRNLSSQMLSKQSTPLIKQQLKITEDIRRSDFEEIMSLTNPSVKKKLLEEFADGADSAANYLKAAALPRTQNHVILPVNSLKDTEVYAPNYNNGEKVVLIRHPHGGIFEIPELTVNNHNKEAQSIMGKAKDAVGINHRVAGVLSGADFDGDTVLVIPNNGKTVKTSKPLKGLKDFDPMIYKIPEGSNIKPMRGKQKQMGDVSNLITDMTIKGANLDEIARAVRHSMVVIDAEKHGLNYRQSAIDNGISSLKAKYQGDGDPKAGAATLISRAKSDVRIGERKPRSAKDGGPINPKTGEKMWTYSGETYTKEKVNKKTGAVTTEIIPRTQKSTRMAEAKDARELISTTGTVVEEHYASYANALKSMANEARRQALGVQQTKQNPTARETYAPQVATLRAKLNVALKNAPLERKARLLANAQVQMRRDADPSLSNDDVKKIHTQALADARARTGAKKLQITYTDKEWEAVQSGAISYSQLNRMLQNSDMDQVRQLAMPRSNKALTGAKLARVRGMASNGYTQAEIAEALGISTSTVLEALG